MQLEPSEIAKIMAEAAAKAVAPLKAEIADLRRHLDEAKAQAPDVRQMVADAVAGIPAPKDGKDADETAIVENVVRAVEAHFDKWKTDIQESIEVPELPDIKGMVKSAVSDAVKAIPVPKDGDDGTGVTVEDVRPLIEAEIDKAVKQIPVPKDGVGMAGAMIDRGGNLIVTMTNGETKELGRVEGKDGLSLESFEMAYDAEEHEVVLKAVAAGRTQEVRYPAGGIHGKGYWRDGNKAKAGEAWTSDGALWVAKKDTSTKPSTGNDAWFLAARAGRNGETVVKKVKDGPQPPIRLKDDDDAGNH